MKERGIEIACSTQNLKQNAKNGTIIWENCGYRSQRTKWGRHFYKFSHYYVEKSSRAHLAHKA